MKTITYCYDMLHIETRLCRVAALTDTDKWTVHPAADYDDLPGDDAPLNISRVELCPAYIHNDKTGQLVLLPGQDRVLVLEDGRRIRENDLLNGHKAPMLNSGVGTVFPGGGGPTSDVVGAGHLHQKPDLLVAPNLN
jgi:hypothetical protein